MSALIPALVTLGVGVGLYATRKKVRFIGDLAQLDDEALVPISKLGLGAGVQLPLVAAYVAIFVEGQDAERVQGRAVSLADAGGVKIDLPTLVRDAIGVQTVLRSDVYAVSRKGKPLAFKK